MILKKQNGYIFFTFTLDGVTYYGITPPGQKFRLIGCTDYHILEKLYSVYFPIRFRK